MPAEASEQGHEVHAHGISPDADRRRLAVALLLILGFMAVEVVAGFLAHSLALLADAAHMLTDAAAIGLSLVAMSLASRPPKGGMTFGLKRAEILSAQANGLTLLLLGGLIVFEGIRRLLSPPEAEGLVIVIVAAAGIVVNLLAAWQISRAGRKSLNVEGSFQHILTDLYAFIGTLVAGGVILATGFTRADGIAAIFVALLMFRAAYGLLRDSGRIFLEAAPEGTDVNAIGRAIVDHEGVTEVHDLHVWEVTSGFPALSAHVLVQPGADCHGIRRELEDLLRERFDIEHTTLQVDHRQAGTLLSIDPQRRRSSSEERAGHE
jgi:cobalt-zinc-cadmium efflux system protein